METNNTTFIQSHVGAWSTDIKSRVGHLESQVKGIGIKIEEILAITHTANVQNVLNKPAKDKVYKELEKSNQVVLYCAKKLEETVNREETFRGKAKIGPALFSKISNKLIYGNSSYWMEQLVEAQKQVMVLQSIIRQL